MIYSLRVHHYRYKQSASPYRSIGELKWVPPLVLPILILRWCHRLDTIKKTSTHLVVAEIATPSAYPA